MVFNNGSALDPAWITFDPATRVIQYRSPLTIGSPIQLKISAADAHNVPTDVVINYVTDFAPKDNPAVSVRTGELVSLFLGRFQLSKDLITDEDPNLSYNLQYPNGTAPPSWLIMKVPSVSNSGDFEFSGTYPVFEDKQIELQLVATDSKGQT